MIHTEATTDIRHFLFKDDGIFPNNINLEVFLYKNVWDFPDEKAAEFLEDQFRKNGWVNAWRDGVYNFHHYHSTAHEVLGIYKGSTRLLLGGSRGTVVTMQKGDVLILPAGVSHKNLDAATGFKCVGAYPKGQTADMNYGIKSERPASDQRIQNVPLPKFDPVFGSSGPMLRAWKR